jgi:hypothetical protein
LEVQQIPLDPYKSKDDLHHLLQDTGFTLKNLTARQTVLEAALQTHREERAKVHKRHEYYRWKELYVEEFREISGTAEEWNKRRPQQQCRWLAEYDILAMNYDRINRKEAVFKEERLKYATDYLLEQ